MSLAGLFRKRTPVPTARTPATLGTNRSKIERHFRELDEATKNVDRRIAGELDVTGDEALRLLGAILKTDTATLAEVKALREDVRRLTGFSHDGRNGSTRPDTELGSHNHLDTRGEGPAMTSAGPPNLPVG